MMPGERYGHRQQRSGHRPMDKRSREVHRLAAGESRDSPPVIISLKRNAEQSTMASVTMVELHPTPK